MNKIMAYFWLNHFLDQWFTNEKVKRLWLNRMCDLWVNQFLEHFFTKKKVQQEVGKNRTIQCFKHKIRKFVKV